jgi:glycine cleavage system H protein
MTESGKVAVVACAGMDKALGSVARDSVFKVVEALRPDKTELICLPPLLAGVSSYSEMVRTLPVIAVDGCAERCATKLVVKNGGKIRGRVLVPDSAKKYGLTPKSASNIGTNGEKLAGKIAEEVASLVDKLTEE